MDCVFCKIAAGEIPADILHTDEDVIAFRDISPQAPVHVVIIPGEHIATLAELPEEKAVLVGHMVDVANKIAVSEGIAESGYRVVINCGQQGGQAVRHLHMHLLGGRQLAGNLG
jgi:histidine triad (HIT) family protein